MGIPHEHQIALVPTSQSEPLLTALKVRMKGSAQVTVTEAGQKVDREIPVDGIFEVSVRRPHGNGPLYAGVREIREALASIYGEGYVRSLDLKMTPQVKNWVFHSRFSVYELGGENPRSRFGESWIICGMEGEKLSPSWITPSEKRERGGRVATFNLWAGENAAAIHVATWRRTVVQVELLALTGAEDCLKSEVVWRGQNLQPEAVAEKLPAKHECFSTAAIAAVEKALCVDCSHAHYAAPKA